MDRYKLENSSGVGFASFAVLALKCAVAVCLLSSLAFGQFPSFSSGPGRPASPANSYQYNNAGVFGGTTGMLWNTGYSSPIIVFGGAGLNDLSATATTASLSHFLYVEIDATGTPDTFQWRVDGGAFTTGVAITGAPQALSNGVAITFAATTGHTNGNSWLILISQGSRISEGGSMYIGAIPPGIANGTLGLPDLMISNSGLSGALAAGNLYFFIGSGTGYDVSWYSSEGTPTTPTSVASGDYVKLEQYFGYDGTDYILGARDRVYIDGAVSAGVVPITRCINGSAAGLQLRATGNIGVLNNAFSCFSFVTEDLGFRRSAAGVFEFNNGTGGSGGIINTPGFVFASLGTPANGSQTYCSDCTVTSGVDDTCAAAGTGAMANRVNGAWKCRI